LIGLSASTADASRMAVGLGLAYYLVGAVLIDTMAQHLHELLSRHPPVAVNRQKEIRVSKSGRSESASRSTGHALQMSLSHLWTLAIKASSHLGFSRIPTGHNYFLLVCTCLYRPSLVSIHQDLLRDHHALKPLLASLVIGLPLDSVSTLAPDFAILVSSHWVSQRGLWPSFVFGVLRSEC